MLYKFPFQEHVNPVKGDQYASPTISQSDA